MTGVERSFQIAQRHAELRVGGEAVDLGRLGEGMAGAVQLIPAQVVHEHDDDVGAGFGGARRDEERARAKERVFSPRGQAAEWDYRDQPPEFWDQYKTEFAPGTHVRIHPLLHWTELDVWRYIRREGIPIVDLYLARPRPTLERDGILIVRDDDSCAHAYSLGASVRHTGR